MSIDPIILESIMKSASALWVSMGAKLLTELKIRGVDEAKWKRAVAKYYTSLYEKVGFVRILGRRESEPLENIYTEVIMLDRITAERRYDIEQLRKRDMPRFGSGRTDKRRPGLKVLDEHDKLFVLGKPGAGKTTFLKWIAIQAIQRHLDYFPIFVSLKEMADASLTLKSSEDVFDYIVSQCEVHRIPEPIAFIKRLLNYGKAVILFDGLDEVNLEDRKRSNLVNALNQFVYQYGQGKVVITCRVSTRTASFTQFKYAELADFSQAQIEAFVDRWFAYDAHKATRCKAQLSSQRGRGTLQELASVPILLTLLCLTFEQRNNFPQKRHTIYEEAIRSLLFRWDAVRNIHRDQNYLQLEEDDRRWLLAVVAAETFERGEYFLEEQYLAELLERAIVGFPNVKRPSGRSILQTIEEQHGLLVERAVGIHSFSHLTIQEYLTAVYIVEGETEDTLRVLMGNYADGTWREVFLLTAGMLRNPTVFLRQFSAKLQRHLADDVFLQVLVYAVGVGSPSQSERFTKLFWVVTIEIIGVFQQLFDLIRMLGAGSSYIIDALDRVVDHSFAFARTHDNSIDHASALAHTLDSFCSLAHAIQQALYSVRHSLLTHDYTKPLGSVGGKTSLSSHDRAYDNTLENNIYYATEVFNDLSTFRSLARSLASSSSHSRGHTGNPQLGVAYEAVNGAIYSIANRQPDKMTSCLTQFDQSYESLRLEFVAQYSLPAEWRLTQNSAEKLTTYLHSVELFENCVALANIADRNRWLEMRYSLQTLYK